MQNILKLEQLGLFLFSIFLFNQTDYQWWWFLVLLFAPDLSMIGYLAGSKVGGFLYNIFHHQALAIFAFYLGWQLQINWLEVSGIILLGHSSMDRVLGYGLKYPDHFKHTHLGWIGKQTL